MKNSKLDFGCIYKKPLYLPQSVWHTHYTHLCTSTQIFAYFIHVHEVYLELQICNIVLTPPWLIKCTRSPVHSGSPDVSFTCFPIVYLKSTISLLACSTDKGGAYKFSSTKTYLYKVTSGISPALVIIPLGLHATCMWKSWSTHILSLHNSLH